jgi:hypothetical protein
MDATGGRRIVGDGSSIVAEDFMVNRSVRFQILALLVLVISSCSRPTPSAGTLQAAAKADTPPVQKLELTYKSPVVGADVQFAASGLPAGKTVDVTWSTVSGGWVIEDYYYFPRKKVFGDNVVTRQI